MAAAQGRVIVTRAITGSIHTPSMSRHQPVTPEEIAVAAPEEARQMLKLKGGNDVHF